MDAIMTVEAQPEVMLTSSVGDQVRLVTTPAAAQLLGVSRSKLYELQGEGVLPTVRIGRSRRIALADLEAFVRSRRDLG